MSERRIQSPSVWLWPLTLAAVVAAVLALIVWRPASSVLEQEISARERERVEDQLAIIGAAVQQSLLRRNSILEGIAAFVASESIVESSRSISEASGQFAAFAANLPLEKSRIRRAWIARGGVVTAVAPPAGNSDLLGRRREGAEGGLTSGETRVGLSDIAAPNGEAIVTALVELTGAGPPSVQVGIDFYASALIEEANLGRHGQDIVVSLRDGAGRVVFALGRGDLFEPAIFPIGVSRGFWQLVAVPAGGWQSVANTYLPLFRMAGWAASAFLGLLVLFAASARARRRRRTLRLQAGILEAEARFNEIASSIPGVIFRLVRKPSGTVTYSYLSDGAGDLFGVEPPQVAADSSWLRRVIHPDDRARFDDMLRASATLRAPLTFEFRVVSSAGKTTWLRSISLPRLCPNGDVAWSGHIADITDARRRLDLLEESEACFRAAFEAHPDGIALYDRDGGLVASNGAAQAMFGSALPAPAGAQPEQESDADATGLARIRRPDGVSAWVLTDSRPIFRMGETDPDGYLQTFTDVSAPHDREAGLIRKGQSHKDAVESALDALWETDADLRFMAIDETASGEPHPIAGALIGRRLLGLHDADAPNAEDGAEEIHRLIGAREPFRNLRFNFADPNDGAGAGAERVFRFSGTAALDQAGIFLGYHGGVREETFAADVPELEPRQQDILNGLIRAADDLPVGLILFDRSDQVCFRNRAIDLVDPYTDLIRPDVSPEEFRHALRDRGDTPPIPDGDTGQDGEATLTEQSTEVEVFFEGWIGRHWLQIRRRDLEGNGTLFVLSDLTDLKAEEDGAARRQIVDAAFEAACQIAADLNAALADSLDDLARLKKGSTGGDAIGDALASNERGAVLGLELLSLLQGSSVGLARADLSKLAADTSKMLRIALRGRAVLDSFTSEALAATHADPIMLEYIVLNLIARTQDLLPGTPKIHVDPRGAWLGTEAAQTLGVPPGDYVVLDVVYPAAATAALLRFKLRAHDATAVGAGDDLGLGLVARFLRQSDGYVAVVASGNGQATLKILLPRQIEAVDHTLDAPELETAPEVELDPAPSPATELETTAAPEVEPDPVLTPAPEVKTTPAPEVVSRGSAIVLEPDPDVRRVTAALLRQLGFEVMESESAEAAIAHGDSTSTNLLVTESRLPGAWTAETLAARLRNTAPDLRIILTSNGGLAAAEASFGDAAILLKPFGLDELSALLK